jgi:hypothetical protein
MPNYINKEKAMVYFRQHKEYTEYRGSPKLQEIYDKKFQDLIKTGTVEKTTWRKLLWINPFHLVSKVNGGMRLVIDMRKVNQFMKPIKFKMEGVTTLKQLWERNDYAISFDLKEAYNHVPVHESLRPLLEVAYRGELYRFVGMPLGLNDAPRVFSMIMRVVIIQIREIWNIKAVVYLDDLILLHQDRSHLNEVGKEVA